MQVGEGQQVQIVQAQPQGQTQQAPSSTGQTMQVMQQIITNTGEIQQIPVRVFERTSFQLPSWGDIQPMAQGPSAGPLH